MAHYALIDSNDIVIQVITGVDEDVIQTDLEGSEIGGSSEAWEEFYSSRPWFNGLYCKRTSYNGKIRKNYAGIGFKYDLELDAFIPPKPFASWILDENTCLWQAPKRQPSEGFWNWNEELGEWINAETV